METREDMLDGSVPDEKIHAMIELSYRLTL